MESTTTTPSEALLGSGVIATAESSLKAHNFSVISVATGAEALAKIKEMIPKGASVMNGSSTTLNQIGFVDYLKSGEHGWDNAHESIVAETDPQKKAALRKAAINADYYLGSAHAVTQDGKIVIASASGSQLPHLAFTSQNIILVVSTSKIVADLDAAFDRIQNHVVPLEDVRMKNADMGGTVWAKTLILNTEPAFMGRNVTIIFIDEVLGF